MAYFVRTLGVAVVAAGMLTATAQAAPITVLGVGDQTGSWAREGWSDPVDDDFINSGMGPGTADTEATAGSSNSQTSLIYSSDEHSSTFDVAFDHVFGDKKGSYARSTVSTLRFTTDEDVEFQLGGFYQTFGLGRSVFKVAVTDNTTGQLISNYVYDTSKGFDQAIVLGGVYTPTGYVVEQKEQGPLTGVLAAGGDYRIYFDAFTITQSKHGGGTGTGAFNFSVSSLNPISGSAPIGAVSEPAGLAVLALGLFGLAALGRRAR